MSKISFSDVVLLLGFLGMAYGFWLAWHPLGFILGGIALIAFALMVERGSKTSRRAA